MADFKDILGHEEIIEHFKNSIKYNKVSHAYILNGEKGSGKSILAAAFAKTLQCEEQGEDACNQCHLCAQADSMNQPDIIWVKHEKPSVISVDEIREQVNGNIGIKPYASKYKIYIIEDAGLMNPQAQNALLKTIEEPPEYALIMLLTDNKDKFLQTILSRCVILNVKPVKEEVVVRYLIDHYGVTEEKAQFCAGFAFGNVGKALRLVKSEEYDELKDESIRLLKDIDKMDISEIIAAIKSMTKYRLFIDDYIDIMMMWYRDILMMKVTGNPNKLIFKEEFIFLKKQASKISFEGIENVLKAMDKAKIRLDANVNFDIVMELLLLTMKEN